MSLGISHPVQAGDFSQVSEEFNSVSNSYRVTGTGSAFIFSHELLTLCQVACDRAALRAFEKA